MSSIIQANKKFWEELFHSRYTGAWVKENENHLADSYRWQGTYGVTYSRSQLAEGYSCNPMFREFSLGFSEISIKHNMLGEDDLLASHFTVTATHTDNYFGIPPTGKIVSFFGTGIAKFDSDGKLVHEWELWDEIILLRQLGLLADGSSGNLIATEKMPTSKPEVKYPAATLLLAESLLHKQDKDAVKTRDPIVARNIAQWERFLAIKYQTRDFDLLDKVMAPNYQWHGSCGFGWDMSDPETRKAILDGFSKQTEGINDYQFTYRLFGEGNFVVYHIVCEYTQTASLINIDATGRKVRHSNISVCQFDGEGRIMEEWETIDILAVHKQLGVIPNTSEITSIAQYLNTTNE